LTRYDSMGGQIGVQSVASGELPRLSACSTQSDAIVDIASYRFTKVIEMQTRCGIVSSDATLACSAAGAQNGETDPMSDIDTAEIGGDADVWHVKMASGEVYTVTVEQLDDAFQKGLIDENILVMKDGMDDWATLAEVLGDDGEDEEDESEPAVHEPPQTYASGESAVEEPAHASEDPATQGEVDSAWSNVVSSEAVTARQPAMEQAVDDDAWNDSDESATYAEAAAASAPVEPVAEPFAPERAASNTLLNYPPPPQLSMTGFSSVSPPVQAAVQAGLSVAPAAPAAAVAPPAPSYPVPPPVEAAPVSQRPRGPVPPPVSAAPYPQAQVPAARSYPTPPPLAPMPASSMAPQARSYPAPPPPGPSHAPQARSYPAAPPVAVPASRSAAPGSIGYPPPVNAGGIYPPPVISSAPAARSTEPPGGPPSTFPVAYQVDDIEIPTPRFRSRGRGAMLAVAASIALVGGAVGLSRMDGSSLMLFPTSSSPVAASPGLAAKPYTPPPRATPRPEVQPAAVEASKPVEPEKKTSAGSTPSSGNLADDMKKALGGAKVKPGKAKPAAKASVHATSHRQKAPRSSSGSLGKGGSEHDPLNGNL
jgi:hypothetical protein